MEKVRIFPDPEKKLAIIKRYLHILALLQNNKDPIDWNGTTGGAPESPPDRRD